MQLRGAGYLSVSFGDSEEFGAGASGLLLVAPELEAINQAYGESQPFADVLTRATKFAADVSSLVAQSPTMGQSTADAFALCAREVQFAAVLGRAGMYRPAFGSLRLALEAVSWGIFLSTDEIASRRWLSNIENLRWSSSVSGDRGILTSQFAEVFCRGLGPNIDSYLLRSQTLYRELSGFVHGEVRTHLLTASIRFDVKSMEELRSRSVELIELAMFMYALRFLDDLEVLDSAGESAIIEGIGHIEYVRLRVASIERS
jgi:hypothetical protein